MMKLEHVALWSREPERLRDYYVAHFNGIAGPLYENARKHFRSYFITFDSGLRLELMSVPDLLSGGDPTDNTPHTGWTHIAFEVSGRNEVDRKAMELEKEGFRIVDGPRVTGDGYYEFTTLDPDNNRLEVSTRADHETSSSGILELTLQTMDLRFAVCLLAPDEPLPDWVSRSTFLSVTRNREETSLVCPEEHVPMEVKAERNWRIFRVKGILDFSLTGILSRLLNPLRDEKIPTFVISTYRTDYLLVRGNDFGKALSVLADICRIETIGASPGDGLH